MGVITSLPEPIKLQIQELGSSQSDTLVVDSMNFANEYEWTARACSALAPCRKRKVVFKLNRMKGKHKKLSQAIGKVMASAEGLCFYGDSMLFLEDDDWEKYWRTAAIVVSGI